MRDSATSFEIGAIKPTCRSVLAHGLRKAGATVAANNGATAHQLMAIFGWDTLKEAEKYTSEGRPTAVGTSRNALTRKKMQP